MTHLDKNEMTGSFVSPRSVAKKKKRKEKKENDFKVTSR